MRVPEAMKEQELTDVCPITALSISFQDARFLLVMKRGMVSEDSAFHVKRRRVLTM